MTWLDFIYRPLLRMLRLYSRKLWVRVVLMGLLAVCTLGLTQLVEPLVPQSLIMLVGGSATDRLLDIIGNAMLAVTTFSLAVMVSIYRATSTQWTPRVHRLIVEDRVTQNTLAAFIGAYVFALIAIIMREIGLYEDKGSGVLFCITVLVVGVVVLYLVRWTLHLQTLGSLIETTRQVEEIAIAQFLDRRTAPCLRANPWDGAVPDTAWAIAAKDSGYVQTVKPEALQELAEKHDVHFYLATDLGGFVFLNEPLIWVEGVVQDRTALADAVRPLIHLDDVRTYDQDPRFGLLVMSEIGSKALSPGVNDPGTAIDVLNRTTRILSHYRSEAICDVAPDCRNLHVRPLDPRDLIEDGYAAICRDGAGIVEVQERLQRVLGALAHHPDANLAHAAGNMACACLERALGAMAWEPDRARVIAKATKGVARE